MMTRASTWWNLVLAGTLWSLLAALPAFAQQPADQPSTPPATPPAASEPPAAPTASKPMPILQPQPTTVPGRPDIPNAEVGTQLRGIPAPPFAAPPDKLPIPDLKLPKGFKIEVYASGIPNARSLRLGDKGTVFVGNRQLDKVYAIVAKNGKREAMPPAWTGRMASPSTTARSTSLKVRRSPRSRTSRTTSTTRRSPSSSTTISSTISRTAGNSWA